MTPALAFTVFGCFCRAIQFFQQRSQKALLSRTSRMPDFTLYFRYSPCHNALPQWLSGSSVSADPLDR